MSTTTHSDCKNKKDVPKLRNVLLLYVILSEKVQVYAVFWESALL